MILKFANGLNKLENNVVLEIKKQLYGNTYCILVTI